jgi:flagellin-like protein
MKKIWAIRKDSEAVSPVIATILMVAITVVLAAVLYVMVLGFGGTSSTPGINVLRKSSIAGGFKIEFTAPTAEVAWSDVTIQLSDASAHTVSWNNGTTVGLTSTTQPKVWHYGSAQTLGSLAVWFNVTDLAANGRMSNGDYITLTVGGGVFAPSTTYTVTLLYEPTSGSMLAYDFTG